MMKKNLFFNLFFVTIINLLVKPLWIFGVDRGIQNSVDLESYGIYFSIFNVTLIFNAVLDLGLTNFNTNHIAKQPTLLDTYFKNVVGAKMALGLLYFFGIFSVYFITGNALYYEMLLVLGLTQFLSSFLLYLRSNISAHQYFFTDGIFSVLDKVLMIIFGFYILYHPKGYTDIEILGRFSYAQFWAMLISCMIAFLVNVRMLQMVQVVVNVRFILDLLKKSVPYASYVFLVTMYLRYDSFILQQFYPQGDVFSGLYARSFRLLDAVNIVGFLLGGILFPLLARWLTIDPQRIPDLLKTAIHVLLVMMIPICIGFTFFSTEIMGLLYTDDRGHGFLKLLIWVLIPMSFHHVFSSFLTAKEELGFLNRISLFVLIGSMGLNILVLPLQNPIWVVFIQLLANVFAAVLVFFKSKKILKTAFQNLLNARMMVYFLGLMLLVYLLQQSSLLLIYKLLVLGLVGIVLSIMLGLVSPAKIKALNVV